MDVALGFWGADSDRDSGLGKYVLEIGRTKEQNLFDQKPKKPVRLTPPADKPQQRRQKNERKVTNNG